MTEKKRFLVRSTAVGVSRPISGRVRQKKQKAPKKNKNKNKKIETKNNFFSLKKKPKKTEKKTKKKKRSGALIAKHRAGGSSPGHWQIKKELTQNQLNQQGT